MTDARPQPPARRGRKLALSASVGGQLFSLIRNVAVARLLGPEEFGVAAAIVLTLAFFEAMSAAGAQNYLVQAKDDDEGLLASYHAITLGRSVLTAMLLVVVGGPLAGYFGVEKLQSSFGLLALSAIAAGLAHGGVRYAQRRGDFRPDSAAKLLGDLASLIVGIAVAAQTHSHVAIVWAIIARNAVAALVSHLAVKIPYRVHWSRQHAGQFWTFGWPLLINGPLLFVSAQADRLFISHELGATALGIYSALIVLIMSPTTAILRWLGTISAPALAKVYHQVSNLRISNDPVYQFSVSIVVAAFVLFVGFACFGTFAVSLLYGPKYAVTPTLVALVGVLQTLRFLRGWPSTLSLAAAANGGILMSTIIRLVALPIGLAGVLLIGGLEGLVAGFIVGELVALLLGFLIVNRNADRPPMADLPPVTGICVAMAVVSAGVVVWGQNILAMALLFVVVAPLGVIALAVSVAPQRTPHLAGLVRGQVNGVLAKLRRR